MRNRKEYWFPAKTYGWGWGVPNTWQGWLVLFAYAAGVAATVVLVPPGDRPVEFFGILAVLTFALLVICWRKGEPPKWRWGRK